MRRQGRVEAALVHGEFHGDVHAGNLFVTPGGAVAMLDFGIMGRLDELTRRVLRGPAFGPAGRATCLAYRLTKRTAAK